MKTILILLILTSVSSSLYSTEEVTEYDQMAPYLRILFSSKGFLKYHNDLIGRKFIWDGENCDEGDCYDDSCHTAQLHLFYLKGPRVKGAEFREFIIDFDCDTQKEKRHISKISEEKGFLNQELVNGKTVPIELGK